MKRILCLALIGLLPLFAAAEGSPTAPPDFPRPAATPAPAPDNAWGLTSGVYEVIRDDPRFEGYTVVADAGRSHFSRDGQFWNQAILQNGERTVFISASTGAQGWTADMISFSAVYQPGSEGAVRLEAPSLESIHSGLILTYGDAERYEFTYDPDKGDFFLTTARFDQDQLYSSSLLRERDGLQLWQSNPGEAFLPLGDAMLRADIPLSEFSIEDYPRTMAQVRAVNQVRDALSGVPDFAAPAGALAAVPLYALRDTCLIGAPYGTGEVLAEIPAGTALTGLCTGGALYAYVEGAEGQRGFAAMKDLSPVYDLAFSQGKDLTADVRWDVIDALVGKWLTLPDGSRLILCSDGSWRTAWSGAGMDGNCLNEGNFRVYGGDEGMFRMVFRTEAGEEWTFTLDLNVDASITLSTQEESLTLTRTEYSTFGNG